MPYNLLLIPIVTGYYILTYSFLFKYNIQRLAQNKIIFESVSVALIIITLGFIIRAIIEAIFPELTKCLIVKLKFFPIKKVNYFWTIIFSCLIAIISLILTNIYIFFVAVKNNLTNFKNNLHR